MGRVTVATVGMLRSGLPDACVVDSGQTVAQAVRTLSLEAEGRIVPLVNGRVASWDDQLHDGDRLELVPVISGGV